MYFLDETFLTFVPVGVVLYWLAGPRLRNGVLLAAAVVWLTMFSPQTLVALVALTLGVVYPFARFGARRHARGDEKGANRIGWIGVGVVLAIATALRLKGYWFSMVSDAPDDRILKWLGFSYFLLKMIHVMRASARAIVTPPTATQLLQYVLFLPTLTSGPLYRVDTFTEQLEAPKKLSWADIHDGSVRMLLGIGKKVVFARPLGKLAFGLHAHTRMQPAAYVLTYVILYLDFSGYSDIAIGLGRLLGFRVPENFKHPFSATTLTQFWRNWHASLGDWLRENVFLPMGGMRARGPRLSAIVLGSMFIVGVWHAFNPIFWAWGLYHGVLLLVENWLDVKPLHAHKTPRLRLYLRYAIVQLAVMGGMFAFIGLGADGA